MSKRAKARAAGKAAKAAAAGKGIGTGATSNAGDTVRKRAGEVPSDREKAEQNSAAASDEIARRRHERGAPDPEGDGPDVGKVDLRTDTASETQQIPRAARPLVPGSATVEPLANDGSDTSLDEKGNRKKPYRKVRALKMGFFNNIRRRAGDVFFIYDPIEFSEDWMEFAGASDPERVTTGNEELKREHDRIMKEKAKEADRDDVDTSKATGNRNPLGAR